MTFPIDLHEFFDQGRADVIMHRELVQTSDIDGEKFVTGSLGMPKRITIYDESDITRQGTGESGYRFKGRKQIVEFEYGDPSFPTKWTKMGKYSEGLDYD